MGFIAAGLAVAAVGAGVSAYGAAKNASAKAKAASYGIQGEQDLYERQSKELNKLIKQKNKDVAGVQNVLDRLVQKGIIGGGRKNVIRKLQSTQKDYAKLAAGNFDPFEKLLKSRMNDALIGTVSTGAPIGTYAELSAETLNTLRQQGIQTTENIGGYLSNEGTKRLNEEYRMLGTEFGVMDQKFNTAYQLDRTRATNQSNLQMQKAATVGVGTTAIGNAIQTVGTTALTYGMYSDSIDIQNKSLDVQQQKLDNSSTATPSTSYVPPAISPYSPGGGYGGYGDISAVDELPVFTDPPVSATYDAYGRPMTPRFTNPYDINSVMMQGMNDGSVLPPKISYNQSSSSVLASIGRKVATQA